MASILIIEDCKAQALAEAYCLWYAGHTVEFAASGQEALHCFQTKTIDLVLLDHDLPDMNGLEVFRNLRQLKPRTPAVMITGRGNERLAVEVMKEGARDYLVKSNGLLDNLIHVVDRVLKEDRIQRQLAAKEVELKSAHAALQEKVSELAELNHALRHEIDERIQTEKALKQSKQKLEKTLEDLGQSQSQVLLSEKMASVGYLAAGMAHEINNPNGFVSSNLFTLAQYLEDFKTILEAYTQLKQELDGVLAGQPLPYGVKERCQAITILEKEMDLGFVLEDSQELISQSKEGTSRIQKIVSDLMEFAHLGHDVLEKIDINASLASALKLIWNGIRYKAEVSMDFAELPKVTGYPQIISQVFINLLLNAAQAIEGKGKISITTRARPKGVQIQIQDTGSGIPREILGRIFDPFFTTKQVGQGTGLGLNMVYNAIKKHDGDIEVTSQVGIGTTFTVDLPINPPENQKGRRADGVQR
jgi:signal transduction histidine kinase